MLKRLMYTVLCAGLISHIALSQLAAADDKMTYAESRAAELGVPVRTLDDLPFEFSWDLEFPAPVKRVENHPHLPTTLFFQLGDGTIHAVDSISGDTKWVSEPLVELTDLPIYVSKEESPLNRNRQPGDPIIYDYRLYVVAQSTLYCIDCEFGQTIWHYELPFEPSTGAYATGVGEGLRVYLGDWTGRVKVVSYIEDKYRPFVLWQWNIRSSTQAQPSGQSERVYVADDQGMLHCFDVDRDRKWAFDAKGAMKGSPLIRGRSLYVGGDDGVFYALHRFSGERLASLFLGAPIERDIFSLDRVSDHVFVWTEGARPGLHAIYTSPDNIAYTEVVERRHALEVERIEKAGRRMVSVKS